MNIYETEHEQVEALKNWWRENGRMVVAGVVLGLGGVLGWNAWRSHVAAQHEAASRLYEQVVAAQGGTLSPELEGRVESFMKNEPGSGYAPLLALALANGAFKRHDEGAAERHLRYVLAHAREAGLKEVARLRLARLLLDQGHASEALSVLDAAGSKASTAYFDEVRGDALRAQDKRAAAREAYERALSQLDADNAARQRIQMKLDDLGDVAHTARSASGGAGS